jgi:site-specific recombinase XerC
MRPDLRIVRSAGISPMELRAGIAHYLARKSARGARPNTIAAYRGDLEQYAGFAERLGHGTLVALQSQRHVARFLDDQSAQGISPRSQARRLSVLRGFFKHARREGWIGHDPTADEEVRFRVPRVIAPELDQLHAVIDAIPRTTPMNLRDRALLRVALDTGARISQCAVLDIPGSGSQATVDLQRLLVHTIGKGGDTETKCINQRTARILEDWLAVRDDLAAPGHLALFVSRFGTRLGRGGLHDICKKWGAAAGVPGLHFHLMRHRRGAMVIEACGDKVGQQFLDHASLATTSHYGRHANNTTFALLRERADIDAQRSQA